MSGGGVCRGSLCAVGLLPHPTLAWLDTPMTAHDFIAKWRASELKESAASHEHFIDFCRLLGEPGPADADPPVRPTASNRASSVIGSPRPTTTTPASAAASTLLATTPDSPRNRRPASANANPRSGRTRAARYTARGGSDLLGLGSAPARPGRYLHCATDRILKLEWHLERVILLGLVPPLGLAVNDRHSFYDRYRE